jgi:hypothetical protein
MRGLRAISSNPGQKDVVETDLGVQGVYTHLDSHTDRSGWDTENVHVLQVPCDRDIAGQGPCSENHQ